MTSYFFMIIVFLITGSITGIMSAMFGFGGGVIVVPVLFWFMILLHMPHSEIMHLAVGTSLAVMVVTNLNTIRSHAKAGNICWDVVLKMAPLVALGAIVGAYSSRFLESNWLRYFFIAFLTYVIVSAWLKRRNFMKTHELTDFHLPRNRIVWPLSFMTGIVSVWLGIGGSVITVPFLRRAKMPMLNASATASGLIPAIAVLGAVGYILAGLHFHGLPPETFGFIYEPAFFGLAIGTLFGVPIGKRLVMRCADSVLSKIYFVILILILISMVV